LFLALVLTPLARFFAIQIDFVDCPGERKVHRSSTPYLGGAAIWVACMAGMLLRYQFLEHITAWAIGGTLLLLVGLWDDRNGLDPKFKLIAQSCAALVTVVWGDSFHVFGIEALDWSLTIFWIVGLSNAVNLLDNMDGLSAGTTGISCLFLFAIAALNGQYLVAGLALSIVGATLGFLRYNFAKPSATIFMGDAGSLFLGFTLAFAGVRLRLPVPALWDLLIPVLVLGLPILDTTLVTIMRIRAGRPVSLGGKDHCSHRLVALGYSQRQAVLALYALACFFGFFGLAAVQFGAHQPAIRNGLLLIVAVVAARFFGKVAQVEVYGPPAGLVSSSPGAS
jgi:UDP-GlcNAc:undecaprenyl-phosphate GlcNAc-1-phosphate transferase